MKLAGLRNGLSASLKPLVCLSAFSGFLFLAVTGMNSDLRFLKDKIEGVQAVTITYHVNNARKQLWIADHEQITKIVEALANSISEPRKDAFALLAPSAEVELVRKDNTSIILMFLEKDEVEWIRWGQLSLKNHDFFEAIRDAVTRAEGKTIDILRTDN